MTLSAAIQSDIYYYLQYQNTNRGLTGEEVQKDYYSVAPIGGNFVWGTSGISAGAPALDLSSGSAYSVFNTMIFDGAHSIQAANTATSYDSYAFSVDSSGTVTVIDENTGQSQQLSHVSYLIFNGAHTDSTTGAYQSIYFIEGSTDAQIAALYNAALGRLPDLPGLEYYAVRLADGEMTMHDAAVAFLSSPEFLAKYPSASAAADDGGVNDQAFITQLYQNILHRTPSATELTYYVDALQGTLPGIAQVDRAQILINFSVSPENTQDVAGWLINTSLGGYTDAGMGAAGSESATAVLTVATGGTVNAALIDPTSISGHLDVGGGSTAGGMSADSSSGTILSGEATVSIYLSSTYTKADISAAAGDSVTTPIAGGATITFGALGGTVDLQGTGNALLSAAKTGSATPTVLVVNGFTSGDYIHFAATATSMVNAGTVTDASAAAMAAAAAKVYTPGAGGTDIIDFFAQSASGSAVVYQWVEDSSHTITAATLQAGVELVGVSSGIISSTTLHL